MFLFEKQVTDVIHLHFFNTNFESNFYLVSLMLKKNHSQSFIKNVDYGKRIDT